MKQVLVIGGGASGLMAAISAARAGAKVTLLEQNKQVGRKLLITGNGRCNLTNRVQALSCYRGSFPKFIQTALDGFGFSEALEFFQGIGIVTRERNGYFYPYSDQASAVVDAMRMEAEHQRVKLALNTKVQEIFEEKRHFFVKTHGWTYEGDALILAAGSCAAPETGSDGSGYKLAEAVGHSVIEPLPALVQLRSADPVFPKLRGVRMEAQISLFSGKKLMAEDTGEVQFTEYGLSGIPVFQVSRYGVKALCGGGEVWAVLNFLPFLNREEAAGFLEERICQGAYKTMGQLLVGLFPKKMADCLLKRAGIASDKEAAKITDKERKALLLVCTAFKVKISASNGFDRAQVCCGGVDTKEVNPKTMESRLVPGLYFAGEVLDIDGACGGYNLQWAWTSGYLAGVHSAVQSRE